MDGASGVLELVARLRRREVSAAEVVDAAIARAREAMPLGAIVTETFERARREAPGAQGPFAGIPTFIKDLAHQAGVPTTWGSRAGGAHPASRDHTFVTRFLRTGVVSLGKSATPELGLTATTEPVGRPPCRNPWDPTRSAGGSSGGAGALVAAGVVPIAHGSDGGGSIRIPASCCGVVGLKPTRGLIDMAGSPLLPVNVAVDGVLTRTVADTRAFYDAMGLATAPARGGPLRIAVFVDAPGGAPVHPEIQAAVRGAARLCESLGHHVDEIRCPVGDALGEDFLLFWGYVAWIQLKTARLILHRAFDADRVEPWTRGIAGIGAGRKRETLFAIRRLRAFTRTYAALFADVDVLVSPVTAQPPPPLGHLDPGLPFEVHLERIKRYSTFTPIQNVAGAPAISLPLGRTADGLPIGVQFAGAQGADRQLLVLAEQLEAAQPWPKIAPVERWRDALATT